MPSIEEKSLRVIEFSGSTKDWDIWSEKFKARGRRKGYVKLLMGQAEIFTKDQPIAAEDGKSNGEKKVTQLGNLNELGYEYLICPLMGSPQQVEWPSILPRIARPLNFLKTIANKLGTN